jgi:hypothetical protein
MAFQPGDMGIMSFMHINNDYSYGCGSLFLLSTTNSLSTGEKGWITSNTFTNVNGYCIGTVTLTMIKIVANGYGNGGSAAQITTNNFNGVGYEASGGNCETIDISGELLTKGDGLEYFTAPAQNICNI